MNWFKKKKNDKPYTLRTLVPCFDRLHAKLEGDYIGSGILTEYAPDREICADLYNQGDVYVIAYCISRPDEIDYNGELTYESLNELMGMGSLNDLARDILRRNGKFTYKLGKSESEE